jgi:hypothetical protein
MPLLAYITMAAVFITAPIIVQATPTRVESLCEEVAYTVNESVDYGTLTQEQADKISDRCYELYS